jgi:hypothetical protein
MCIRAVGPAAPHAAALHATARAAVVLALTAGAGPAAGQALVYIEPGVNGCPALPAPTAPKTVLRGTAVPGSISVRCGFDKGSYTVTLNTTDPAATISPKTFLVNFGSVSGRGTFTVTFATPGLQAVTASITSNMGSPAVGGRFESASREFTVVHP